VEQPLLDDNDTLINKVLNYFETHKDKPKLLIVGKTPAAFRDLYQV
jgi:hypothetical protein